jgi:TIR domain
LHWADAVVCVVTSSYLTSLWCTAEAGIALSRGSRVLPVRAESGVNHPLLTSLQYADLTVDPTVARAALVEELRRVDAAITKNEWDHLPVLAYRPRAGEPSDGQTADDVAIVRRGVRKAR